WTSEVAAGGPQARGARYWLGRIARVQGQGARADSLWRALAREDSLGYYGAVARRAVEVPAPRVAPAPRSERIPVSVAAALAAIDTLKLARLDSEARLEVRYMLLRPPQDPEAILALSEGLAQRGFGGAAVRLAWNAATALSLNQPRVLRAVFPWPMRALVELEANENGVDPYLFVALIRQESTFDTEALSPAGARGLAQLVPGTASLTARGLDVSFRNEWITVPDLNLHLGAAHLADLLRQFGGRVEVALAAYNAGTAPARRWLAQPGADDPELFVELVGYPETRNYVRSVLRNRDLYRALYPEPAP
ncbi:MAG: lytic transglycosylase domain-containing protein, partial [Gemmatimonadales bacterium]